MYAHCLAQVWVSVHPMVIFMTHACCERCFWSLRLLHSLHLFPHHLSVTLLFLLPDTFNFHDVVDKYRVYFRWGPWHSGRERASRNLTTSKNDVVGAVTLRPAVAAQFVGQLSFSATQLFGSTEATAMWQLRRRTDGACHGTGQKVANSMDGCAGQRTSPGRASPSMKVSRVVEFGAVLADSTTRPLEWTYHPPFMMSVRSKLLGRLNSLRWSRQLTRGELRRQRRGQVPSDSCVQLVERFHVHWRWEMQFGCYTCFNLILQPQWHLQHRRVTILHLRQARPLHQLQLYQATVRLEKGKIWVG